MAEQAAGLGFAMPTLQYNDEGWGPYEISDTFRDMPYQVMGKKKEHTYIKAIEDVFRTPNDTNELNLFPGKRLRWELRCGFFRFRGLQIS